MMNTAEVLAILRRYDVEPVPALVQSMTAEEVARQAVIDSGQDGQAPFPSLPPAVDRSIELLKQWLTPRQKADFEDFGCFDVVGGATGTRYRLTDGAVYNIQSGTQKICVVPQPSQSAGLGDRLLAQKIALETDEMNTLMTANIGTRAQSYPAASVDGSSGRESMPEANFRRRTPTNWRLIVR